LTLDAFGQASLPLAGVVGASGETTLALENRIRAKLASYVRRPAVDVQLLAQGANIFVSGGPGGVLAYAPGETLSGALSQLRQTLTTGAPVAAATQGSINVPSDSTSDSAIDYRHIVIRRDGIDLAPVDAQQLAIVGNPGPLLQPDDTIKLSYKPIPVEVLGEVNKPGDAYLDPLEPLSDALRQAGEPSASGSAFSFYLTRNGERRMLTTSSPEYSQPASPGDVVFVPHDIRISVVGQVYKPGDVELRGDTTLLSALYYAGGPTHYGNIKYVTVIHQGEQSNYDVTRLTHGAPAMNPTLNDGDTVFVPEGHKIDFSLLFQGIISAAQLRFL
jgi:protein involved in polysaccharide export with SLBB domain